MADGLSSRISDLLQSHQTLGTSLRAHGLVLAALPWVLKQLQAVGTGPIVVICPSPEEVETVINDLSSAFEMSAIAFPGWDRSIYSAVAPSLKTRFDRIAALEALVGSSSEPQKVVLVTTLDAAARATLAPTRYRTLSRSISVGESLMGGREAWIQGLASCGYGRVDPVEDPGTFAVRGEIIDLFPPGQNKPVRIELFDDTVERIRPFDPLTQRTEDGPGLNQLSIPVAREGIILAAERARVREILKTRADDIGLTRPVRDPLLSLVQDGGYPERSEAWAPWIESNPASLIDYLPSSTQVVWWDELGCTQNLEAFLKREREESTHVAERSLLLPEVGDLYRTTDAEAWLRAKTTIFFDRIELREVGQDPTETQLEPNDPGVQPKLGTSHRLQIRTNTDLARPAGKSSTTLDRIAEPFTRWLSSGYRIQIYCLNQSQLDRVRFLLSERGWSHERVSLIASPISSGFRWPAEKLITLTGEEFLGTPATRPLTQKRKNESQSGDRSAPQEWSGLRSLSDLVPGDGVVHIDHGIGRYSGMARLELNGTTGEFLLIEYAESDRLYLPVYRLDSIQKYAGAGESLPLDKLGSAQFAKAKEKARASARKLAVDLIRIYAERKVRPAYKHRGRDEEFQEFESRFPYEETPDQLKAINQVLSDLQSGRAMDRLICGDVGYGKTEIAIRAAYRVVADGKQVLVLVPTTILAHQHEQSFRSRMAGAPVRIESISRFKSAREQKKILEDLQAGKVDIVIGTHRLLSKDVQPRDLGLLIVDEEHRFGVDHKEKLKTLKSSAHVLTLTATPIPRTLQMSLSGLRDISLIHTAPAERLPIRTYVAKYDDELIRQALEFELGRDGQVFFVHNRVQSIYTIAQKIQGIVPQARIVVAHGQMAESELEKAVLSFYERRANILVCTSIIESGIDLPSANTILIDRADAFGLAQLYQMRGRVGRGQTRAYAYLMIPSEGGLSEEAKKRLEVIQRFVDLGSGFQVASHDLEIRGGGELLGPNQSGHIAAVGFELYLELLNEAIHELEGEAQKTEDLHREPEIKLPFPAYLPETYVPDPQQRLSLYRRFSMSRNEKDVDSLEGELKDRFGGLPAEAVNLLWLIRIKNLLKLKGIEQLTVGQGKVSLTPSKNHPFDPVRVIALLSSSDQYSLTPDSRLIVKLPTDSPQGLLFGLEKMFEELSA